MNVVLTCAEAVIFSLSCVVNEADASVASFSQGSYNPGPPEIKLIWKNKNNC